MDKMWHRHMTFESDILPEITKLYSEGKSAIEIKEELKLPYSPRSIQKYLKSAGLIRTVAESFRLAVKKGRVKYYTKDVKSDRRVTINKHLRFKILKRDNYLCKICGATTANDIRLEIDHINEDKNDNREENLQVLCNDCNKGKFYASGKHFTPTRKPDL